MVGVKTEESFLLHVVRNFCEVGFFFFFFAGGCVLRRLGVFLAMVTKKRWPIVQK